MRVNFKDPRVYYPVISLEILLPLLYYYLPVGNGLDMTGHPLGRDFINVWAGPQLAFDGRLATLFDLQAYITAIGKLFGRPVDFANWGYPPFTLPLFWPLAQLPYFWALAVWTFGLLAIFSCIVVSQAARENRPYALVALILAPACLINILGGQNGFLSASLLIGGALSIDRRPLLAGVLFGLLTFKPHLGLVIPFALLALRAWRVIAAATLTALVLVAISIAMLGIEPWRQYLGVTSAFQLLLIENFDGFYTIMMASILAGARTFGIPFPIAMAVQVAIALPVLAAACWAVRRTTDPLRRTAVLVCAVPLVTPYAFNYDLTAIAAVIVWRLTGTIRSEGGSNLVWLFAWLAPTAMMPLNIMGLGLAPLALLGAFVMSVREVRAEWLRGTLAHVPARQVPARRQEHAPLTNSSQAPPQTDDTRATLMAHAARRR